MSLKYKLTVLFGIGLLAVMIVTAIAAQRVARYTVESQAREQMDLLAKGVQNALNREVWLRGYLTKRNAQAVVESALTGYPGPIGASLQYRSGSTEQKFRHPMFPYGIPVRRVGEPEVDRQRRTLSQSYVFDLERDIHANLELEVSITEGDQLAYRLARVFIVVTGGVLSVLLLLTWYLAQKHVSAPLSELKELTRKVTDGNFEVRPTDRLLSKSDEIGDLTEAFQSMLTALRRARDENQRLLEHTQGFNRELAERIQEATRDLADKSEALIDAREALARRERLAALGQLVGSIAHEIGTPLSTLSGYLQLVLADESLSNDVREPLEVAAGEAQRMTQIIRSFLDSARGLRSEPQPVNLTTLVEEVLSLVMFEGIRERYSITVDVAAEAELVVTDPGLLRQVLTNLIKNAIDAVGESGAVQIRGWIAGDELSIQVEDDGPGIPTEDLERIFEPFFTTKGPRQGTGLGLPICKEIMRVLKGSLSVVTSVPGAGICFELRLPHVSGAVPTDESGGERIG